MAFNLATFTLAESAGDDHVVVSRIEWHGMDCPDHQFASIHPDCTSEIYDREAIAHIDLGETKLKALGSVEGEAEWTA